MWRKRSQGVETGSQNNMCNSVLALTLNMCKAGTPKHVFGF